ncbi:similar to Saccharomyces cerevisiae YGL115W SNF4 Activating gamma subunit of the AMP-activated Snf1p kinase complex (contains Snf1p and a Sip1p/Sip2p/Gal83p family member) [Maudiozyma barnettii]|uniref:5'-AMP-activated protein kinase subunit gamma n=1 Tax=Maudiozyma barnettii TaxID=61262 RepID=A0A8H2ZMM1_9SACH|nr:AMP-activated serine/threonine-protein kinase regulatory subunit SNF4 [Kazachstania barnettii]CAB4257227.1 similar to Saccharomyces cerevisiae YGL115W SNF4 Activating gamma subunit of the AMP-activated Snf1p kinase complex (contains Snf1p and a Sip1p/Sip2p/Gal83p family member) [Kazachstania barnettii]CAD1779597.1 similar to Saccharomyces cerevisiae YGL115W SNF4 Activating gamma subunit of the AMP-activated Snf1p kinase complex (contains Snf1p and a Sip1p/Sip2p/Gal83p family member) [Kazachsta
MNETGAVSDSHDVEKVLVEQKLAVESIRTFLKSKTSYDVLPVSYRLVVLDTSLLVKKSLNVLLQNNIVSAPLWDSKSSKFAGLLTSNDFINVIQYYFSNPDKFELIDKLQLEGLRDVERAIGVEPLDTASIHPSRPLFEACLKMLDSKSRRIPLIDKDEETHREIVVSVLTQYRILKFVSLNCRETHFLKRPIGDLGIVSDHEVKSCHMTTPVIDVIQLLSQGGVSSIPIVDDQGILVNVYEAVDVLGLIKGGIYNDLSLSVGEALMRRSDDFEGVYTCTRNDRLSTIMDNIRKSRVHRFFVVDEAGRLAGVLTLSDILNYILLGAN